METKGQEFEITSTLQCEANCYDEILKIYFWGRDEESELRFQKNEVILVNEKERKIIENIDSARYGNLTSYLKRISASSFWSLKQFIEKKKIDGDAVKLWEENYNKDLNSMYEKIEKELKPLIDEWKEDSKLSALLALLRKLEKEEKESRKFKAIIFSCFMDTCDYLEDKLKEEGYHIYKMTGKTSTSKIKGIKKEFENENEKSILICSDAAKEGHNLQFCHYLIHYDLPFTPAAIAQRNGRIYRRGQENNPQAYYLLLNKGYDKRLFGEIIIEKCRIVKKYADDEKISAINILPWDAKKYINDIVDGYIKDYFKEEKQKKSNENKEKSCKQIFQEFIEKHFKEIKIGEDKYEWCSEEIRKLYEFEGDYVKKLCDFYKDNILCPESSAEKIDGIGLSEIYREKYNERLKEFLKKIFDVIDVDKAEIMFIQKCDEYVENFLGENKETPLFCHDILKDKDLNIGNYKEKFKMLEKLQRNEV